MTGPREGYRATVRGVVESITHHDGGRVISVFEDETVHQRSIDSDPELFHGLTLWCPPGRERGSADELRLSAQIRDHGLALNIGPAVEHSTEDGQPFILPAEDARALRDLLNIATARGYL